MTLDRDKQGGGSWGFKMYTTCKPRDGGELRVHLHPHQKGEVVEARLGRHGPVDQRVVHEDALRPSMVSTAAPWGRSAPSMHKSCSKMD